jgi:phosphopantothenoylcysteine decarboxylase / phosphopantothenate---cysteine ligase
MTEHEGVSPGIGWKGRRLLISAGPTYEPIDAVRYLGNRSSGRLGLALAETGAALGAEVLLLLGPGVTPPVDPRVRVERFTSAADLGALLERHQPWGEVLIMAAAVADFTPRIRAEDLRGKWKRERAEGGSVTVELVPTPDLLAACAARRSVAAATWGARQRLVGFALEPRDQMITSARAKLDRKRVDAIVANPLETMESDEIEACVLVRTDAGQEPRTLDAGRRTKRDFAAWLLNALAAM